jgi:hypothetical protein
MKIEHDRNGYSIKLYDIRKRFTAKTIEELKLAIEHYFSNSADGKYHATKENDYKGLKDCPLCKED